MSQGRRRVNSDECKQILLTPAAVNTCYPTAPMNHVDKSSESLKLKPSKETSVAAPTMSATIYASIPSGSRFERGDEIQVEGEAWKPVPEIFLGRRYVTEVPMRHGVDVRRPIPTETRKPSSP